MCTAWSNWRKEDPATRKMFRMRFKSKKKLRCESIPWEGFRYNAATQSIELAFYNTPL